jgi:multidrug efflux system membrane fusion protein
LTAPLPHPVRLAALPPREPPASPWRNRAIGIAILAVVLLGFWYFYGRQASGPARAVTAAPVRVAAIVRRDMPVVERSLGTVVANTMVNVTARVQGTLDKALFQEGQFVKQDQLLFQIDPRPFEAALAQARAIYERDQAQLVNATRDKARYAALSAQGAISTQLRDSSATTADVLTATVAADKAALDMAALNLTYTQIRSPVDGKTGPVLVQPGNMVAANGTTVLVTIAQVHPVKISFTLPQTDLARIQKRQAEGGLLASLDVTDAGGKPLTAPVDFTSNAVNAQSGTIELRTQFDNKDLSLVPGALVNVTVELGNIPDALVVPRDAVNDGPNGSYVYVVKDERAEEVPVNVLFDDTKNVAIEGKLAPGDQVITEGQLRVVPDGAVRVFGGGDGAASGGKAGGRRGGRRGGKRAAAE